LHEREQFVARAPSFWLPVLCDLSTLRIIEKREGHHVHLFKIKSAIAMRMLATLHLLACFACAAGTAIAGPWDPNEVKLVPMKISDGLYALVSSTAEKNNPADIPEATTGGIVIGANGVLVVESMLNERLANQVLRYVKELAGDKPIRYLEQIPMDFTHSLRA
jgi:hypothetical protein